MNDSSISDKAPSDGRRWYKGNLHTHTFWSDGRAFPEESAAWYKAHGYHFLALSDHNVFQDDPARWVPDAKCAEYLPAYQAAFPDAEVRPGAEGGREARALTFDEFSARLDEPGRFLLLPAFEATRTAEFSGGRSHQLHMNVVNVPRLLPSIAAPDFVRTVRDVPLAEFLRRHVEETQALARSLGRRAFFMLNHPIWQWYDIPPEVLVETPGVRFFEVCNNGSKLAPAEGLPTDGFDTDRFWDVVNAFRARRGQPLLYGLGTDDTHFYRGEDSDGMIMPGNAWIRVRAASLGADALLDAMEAGDFVACEGLEPGDVRFDPATGTLRVDGGTPPPGVVRTIRFLVSKRDFSEEPVRTFDVRPASAPDAVAFERTIRVYDERIGREAACVEGAPGEAVSASYTLAPDDLYVRARIEEPGQPLCTVNLHPQRRLVAWTQPYARA